MAKKRRAAKKKAAKKTAKKKGRKKKATKKKDGQARQSARPRRPCSLGSVLRLGDAAIAFDVHAAA